MIGGGSQANVPGGQAASRRHHFIAGGKILAGSADVAAGGHGFVYADRLAVGRRVFLQQDRIGAIRDDAAGEQTDGLPGANRRKRGGRRARRR